MFLRSAFLSFSLLKPASAQRRSRRWQRRDLVHRCNPKLHCCGDNRVIRRVVIDARESDCFCNRKSCVVKRQPVYRRSEFFSAYWTVSVVCTALDELELHHLDFLSVIVFVYHGAVKFSSHPKLLTNEFTLFFTPQFSACVSESEKHLENSHF